MGYEPAVLVTALLALCAATYGVGVLLGARGRPLRRRVAAGARRAGLLRGRPQAPPPGRPLETVTADLRRLGPRFHALAPGAPYVKVQAVRGAYDRVLGEACDALGLPHLLGVLGDGPELDRERERVEQALTRWTGAPPHAA